MKFLHTADWQLGARLHRLETRAQAARETRFQAAEAVVELAIGEGVDFVVLAGDTFEHHDVSDRIVARTVEILGKLAPIDVYMLPGNHDPLRPGSIWSRNSWQSRGEHIHLLDERRLWNITDDVVILASPLTQKQSNLDPTGWIPERADDDRRIRIGVAHGGLDILPEKTNFPIDPDRAIKAGLEYLALGDWHGKLIRQAQKVAYASTIEATGFSEKDPGHALIVTIDGPGMTPQIEARRVGKLRWEKFTTTIRDITDVESLRAEIEDVGELASLVLALEIELPPSVDEEVVSMLTELEQTLRDGAFFVEWSLDNTAYISGAEVELPPGVLSKVDEGLRTILEGRIPDGPAHSFAGRDVAAVREARALLHQLARKGQS